MQFMSNVLRKTVRIRTLLLASLLSLSAAGCTDYFTAPATRTPTGLGISYAAVSSDPAQAYDRVDRVRVRITGGGLAAAIDTTLVFAPGQEQHSLQVEIAGGTNVYQVEVELREGSQLLFRGAATAQLTSGRTNEVTVQPQPVAAALVLPDTLPRFWQIGDTMTVPAVVRFASGDALPGAAVTWVSTNPDVATVDASGRVRTHRPGDALLRARHDTFVDSVAVRVRVAPVRERTIAAGAQHTCVISEEGITVCAGDNTFGQLGNGPGDRPATQVSFVQGDVWFTQIDASWYTTCGLNYDGQIFCWGQAVPGFASNEPISLPVPVSGDLRFTTLSVGNNHVCGMATDSQAYCSGANNRGQLGVGDTLPRFGFQRVVSPEPMVAIQASLTFTCGLTAGSRMHCWGWNQLGQTGIEPPSAAQTRTDLPVPNAPAFTSLATGPGMGCGLAGTTGYCWGTNYYGSMGRGELTPVRRMTPEPVSGAVAFRTLVAGRANNIFTPTCGIATDGAAWCWGANTTGQLGTLAAQGACTQGANQFSCSGVPLPVTTNARFVSLAVGSEHVCGLTEDRRVLCWGRNESGQLGTFDDQNAATPVEAFRLLRMP